MTDDFSRYALQGYATLDGIFWPNKDERHEALSELFGVSEAAEEGQTWTLTEKADQEEGPSLPRTTRIPVVPGGA